MDYKIKSNTDFVVINQDLNNLTIEYKDIPSLISELGLLYDGYSEVKQKEIVSDIEYQKAIAGAI